MRAATVQLCRYRCEICGRKINDLMKEETGTSILFYPPTPLGSPDPFALWPLPGSHIRSFLSSYPALLRPPLPQNCLGASRYCRLLRTLFCFQSFVGCTSAAELQSHRRILAPRPNRALSQNLYHQEFHLSQKAAIQLLIQVFMGIIKL